MSTWKTDYNVQLPHGVLTVTTTSPLSWIEENLQSALDVRPFFYWRTDNDAGTNPNFQFTSQSTRPRLAKQGSKLPLITSVYWEVGAIVERIPLIEPVLVIF